MSNPYSQSSTRAEINTYNGEWTKVQICHLLKRTMFGATVEDIAYFKEKTLDQTVDELLQNQDLPLPPLNYYETADYKDPQGIKFGETWVNAAFGDGTVNFKRNSAYKYWWIMQMRTQKRSIREKMILFWHNHFATEVDVINDARYAYLYNLVLRKNALGNFKDFVKEITLDPAMLKYLNGRYNTKDAPDENYARELQELFTIGKGFDAKFTEDDVKAAAKILTGFRINSDTKTYSFSASKHDTTDKKFSAFYNNTVVKGISGENGEKELDELLAMIFKVDEVSKFICRKLYQFFVYYDITTTVEKNVIEPLAKVFRENNYEIKPVIATLLKSQHFFEPNFYGAIIKSPLDLVIGTLREFNVEFPSTKTNLYEYYSLHGDMMRQAEGMQQAIGEPPNVAGWPAYYQAPNFHEIWINSDTYIKRNQFTNTIIKNGFPKNGLRMQVDVIAFAKKLENPSDPNKLVSQSIEILFKTAVSSDLIKQLVKDILLSGQSSDYYWTELWDKMIQSPTDKTTLQMVTNRLRDLYKYLLGMPEYQLS
ncbi:hypothetical protein EMA8858_01190 [Emticicia aquatica]|uniref:DUF1800 domain-containing protein n=1 Tax=Emticicia aquatica TaxID=1681835 RepID=A0ABM9AMR1_9BACT|nr:DUF1800 domain-containing protein [Emticicia aquatica]CAH0995070.1 hypothetical protein EMA8858_01190 [Emticicia aquatica]